MKHFSLQSVIVFTDKRWQSQQEYKNIEPIRRLLSHGRSDTDMLKECVSLKRAGAEALFTKERYLHI